MFGTDVMVLMREWNTISASRLAFLDDFANWNRLKRIFITFDVDWAPDYMISPVIHALNENDVRATFFATHDSPLLRQIAAEGRHEVGFHPNLGANSSQGEDTKAILEFLARLYPHAVGNRFHVLGHSYRDLVRLRNAGIRYDVSSLLYRTSHLQPAFHRDIDLVMLPYTWEDGIAENSGDEVSIRSMSLDTPGLKIVNFHPMNIFINGPTAEPRIRFMQAVGPLLDCPEAVARTHQANGEFGARSAFEGLLRKIRTENIQGTTLRDLCNGFLTVIAQESNHD